MNILQAKNLKKSYHSRTVVKDVSFNVHEGEIVGLLGPNGAGKTTSFYMVLGLIQNDDGQIFFNEQNITHLPIHARARLGLGYLPQEASIFRKLNVAQNIMAILELQPALSNTQRKEQCEKLLEELHIAHLQKNTGMSLSGGERRRVEIARALAGNPKFILLDEPFAGIDPISVIDLKHIIRHLKDRKIGIFITDHNVRETLDICDRAYIVNDGKIICEGNSEQILHNQEVIKVYLGKDFEL
ncbi:MAG: LPS export ABC transporter ATP-binding protein [Gammaproteobacteria bacterium RIFCSPHIGHO2_02_FULL_42_13]|nr:MAG: LPS export ABC transporter ATP-binding protein [Gammaproteobacteria bacterium RIFCSPHIGHO2_02_FULL_42_13]OGT68326.1 MAG: LPS export ABC transporter ATP-binding protein [Gammaproteobacteria bacterium RIFCSPLOWO2_02_FULL_42_9]